MQSLAGVEYLALVYPYLNAYPTIGRMRLRKAVIDVRSERLEGYSALVISFAAGDFGAAQTAGDLGLYTLGAHLHGSVYGLTGSAPERYPLLEIERYALGHELCVEVDFLFLNYGESDGLLYERLDADPELLYLLAALAYNGAGPGASG